MAICQQKRRKRGKRELTISLKKKINLDLVNDQIKKVKQEWQGNEYNKRLGFDSTLRLTH